MYKPVHKQNAKHNAFMSFSKESWQIAIQNTVNRQKKEYLVPATQTHSYYNVG